MLVGMTTNVYQNNAIALFNHQMIPHHQNAVNMCKSLFKSGEVECDDVEDEEDPSCVITVLCHEIINVQNFQIQTMRGVLDALDLPQEDDCVVPIEDDSTSPPKTPVPSVLGNFRHSSKVRGHWIKTVTLKLRVAFCGSPPFWPTTF